VALALVTRIPNLGEAQVAAGALRSAGIQAEVFDVTFGGMEAPVIESLGGYRLMAPEEDVREARELLRALRASPPPREPDDDGTPWSEPPVREVNRRGMKLVALLVLGSPFILWVLLRLIEKLD
jgi:hypothetical protein